QPSAARTPPANPSSAYHPCRRPGICSTPNSTAKNPCPGEPRRAVNAAPTPAYIPNPERAAGLTSNCSVSCARAAARLAVVPPARSRLMRLSALGRCATPSSAPTNVCRAIAAAPPRLSSVAVNSCACAMRGRHVARPASATLRNGDVVTDRDVGRERRNDGAVLREREIDGTPHLHVVGTLAAHGEMQRHGREPPRLRLAARAVHRHVQGLELDPLFLENDHDVRCGARGGGEEQQLDGRRGGRCIAVHENRPTADATAFKLQVAQPAHRYLGRPRHASCPAAS